MKNLHNSAEAVLSDGGHVDALKQQRLLVERFAAPVPRYTSYPTSPHFHDGITSEVYATWLGNLAADARISLYIHVPFCDRLCWFCACHTKHTLKYQPIATYLEALYAEMRWVAERLTNRGSIKNIHFGGGSPSLLAPKDMLEIKRNLVSLFNLASDVQISVEIDPNDIDDGRIAGMAEMGMTRASFGVQDFNPKVQETINRIQTLEQTKNCVDTVRRHGINSVNIDMLYGLPHQTVETVAQTAEQVIGLSPDRVALFGYAHVPWMKKHQQMIDQAFLPDAFERFLQAGRAASLMEEAGYDTVGFDHFAKPDDTLAIAARTGTLHRNFQGYTTDNYDALIGLGASSISSLPEGYVQNTVATNVYQTLAHAGDGVVEKGFNFSIEDKDRARVIEELLCKFEADFSTIELSSAEAIEALASEAREFAKSESSDLLSWKDNCLTIGKAGHPFARSFAALFDAYLPRGVAKHSSGV